LKKVGETVQRDEPLLEISTDKVDAEIPAPAAGVVTEILAKEGDTVAVNSVLARLGEAGEVGAGASAAAAAAAPAPAVSEALQPSTAPRQVEAAPAQADGDSRPLPSQAPAPTQPQAAPPQPPPQARAMPAAAPALEEVGRARSSPLVRNIAREHGVNLDEISGTGLGGRVTKDDILDFINRRKGAPAAAAAPAPAPIAPAPAIAPAAPPAPPTPAFAAGDRVTIEPMSNMRRRIAENMLNSRRVSAHVTTIFEVDFTNIARLRERVKKQFEAQNGAKLTFLPFVIKATIDALKALPVVNSSVEGENIVYKHDYNIGIAVALDWGLIVPVIKQADALSLTGLARSSQDLANRARSKQLKPDEVSGGTFSITNFGLFGGYTAAPIINQPQVAILGLGGVHKRPWVVETADGDAIAIRHIAALSLSFDHRVIDGAVADQFLAHIKKTIETTDFSALL
jgi:2-oxoglutarate dehydrogenase E2 component (dihydrolipoamide succinyltransferase)